MYVTKGGGVNATLTKKHRVQYYAVAISNQHWVCKFEERGWNTFLRKNREIIVICRKNLWWWWGGGFATLLKMGLRGILVCGFVKIKTLCGCRNSNNLLIHQILYFLKSALFLQQLGPFYRSCSLHVI